MLLKVKEIYERAEDQFLNQFNIVFHEDINEVHIFYRIKDFEKQID